MAETTTETTTPPNGTAAAPPAALAPSPAKPAAAATIELRQGEIVRMNFDTVQGFEAMQRAARLFSFSTLVPKHYQATEENPNALANCVIALNMAQRIGADPLMVMQNLYIVHGNPGWSSKFLIAGVNSNGRFSAIRYEWRGAKGQDEWACRAWAVEKETGERLEGAWITWGMAQAEGWTKKNGSKWLTMPEQMFIYRAAAFWVRAYAPEITMGLQTVDEIEDVGEQPARQVLPPTSAPPPPGVQTPAQSLVAAATAAAPVTPAEDPTTKAAGELLVAIDDAKTLVELVKLAPRLAPLTEPAKSEVTKAYEEKRGQLTAAKQK